MIRMIKITKKELNRKIRQAQIRAIKATLGLVVLYSLSLTGIVYMFMK